MASVESVSPLPSKPLAGAPAPAVVKQGGELSSTKKSLWSLAEQSTQSGGLGSSTAGRSAAEIQGAAGPPGREALVSKLAALAAGPAGIMAVLQEVKESGSPELLGAAAAYLAKLESAREGEGGGYQLLVSKALSQPETPELARRRLGQLRVALAAELARQLSSRQPPDSRQLTLSSARAPAGASAVTRLEAEMKGLVGHGDHERLKRFQQDNRKTLDCLVRAAALMSGDSSSRSDDEGLELSAQLAATAARLVSRLNPALGVRILATQEGFTRTLGRQPLAVGALPRTNPLLLSTEALQPNGETQSTAHFFDESAFVLALRRLVLSGAPEAKGLQAATKALPATQVHDRLLTAFLSLPPAEQERLVGKLPVGSGGVLGGLLRRVELKGTETFAAVSPGALGGEPTYEVSVRGVEGLKKAARYLTANAHVVFAPTFLEHTLLRGDAPRPLTGGELEQELALALGLPVAEKFASGEVNPASGESLFSEEQLKATRPAADRLRQIQARFGQSAANVTVLPTSVVLDQGFRVDTPLFRIETPEGPYFVDTGGLEYKGFERWKKDNHLPPGMVVFPKEGRLSLRADGSPDLEVSNTPAVVDTLQEQAVEVADKVALTAGAVVGTLAIMGTGGVVLPVSGVLLSGYGMLRTGNTMLERAQQGATLSPLTAEGFSLWLSLASSTTGLAGLGGLAVRSAGARLSPGLVSGALVASQYSSVATVALQAHDLVAHWDSIDPKTRALVLSNLALFGFISKQAGSSAYDFRALRAELAELGPKAQRVAQGDAAGAGDSGGAPVGPESNVVNWR